MSSGVSARKALSSDQYAVSPALSGQSTPRSSRLRSHLPVPARAGSPASTLHDTPGAFQDTHGAFPGVSRPSSVHGSTAPSIAQAEALEAANAIDAVLRKRSEPVHERLKESLVNTLRSQAKIVRSLNEIDVDGIAAKRGLKTGLSSADVMGGTHSFGKQLAASWTSLPDSGLDGGRSRMLERLDGTQAARVRGLLTHLEFAVQADPSLNSKALLNMAPSEMDWYDGPSPCTSPLLPGLDPTETVGEKEEPISIFPKEDDWPYQRFRPEVRSRHSGKTVMTGASVNGTAAERLMSFRENLRMAYSSLGEAFAAMDMDGRGCISFDHFHAHLVRLKLSKCDAEGSIRAVELFKLLDADANDLITPNDCLRAFEAAAREIKSEISHMANEERYEADCHEHGYVEGAAHVRFEKTLMLIGDDALRVATIRRFFELQGKTLIQGLRTFDEAHCDFLRKQAFACGLIESGYCVSASEAMDLFRILDVHEVGALSIRYLEVLDKGERLGMPAAEHRPPAKPQGGTPGTAAILDHPKGHQLRSGIGSGGLFSDPGRLDGPRPPPRLHARLEQLREWDPDDLPSIPCTSRKPIPGDIVVASGNAKVLLNDVEGKADAWDLQPGEFAEVVQVDGDYNFFRLRNPRNVESGLCARSKFLFKKDIFARLYVETTASSRSQHPSRKNAHGEASGAIIDQLLLDLEATPVRSNFGMPVARRKPGVSSRTVRTEERDEIRTHSRSASPRSPSPRKRGESPPAVGPIPRGGVAQDLTRTPKTPEDGLFSWNQESSPRPVGGTALRLQNAVAAGNRVDATEVEEEGATAYAANAFSWLTGGNEEEDEVVCQAAATRKKAAGARRAKLKSSARAGNAAAAGGFANPGQTMAKQASQLSERAAARRDSQGSGASLGKQMDKTESSGWAVREDADEEAVAKDQVRLPENIRQRLLRDSADSDKDSDDDLIGGDF